MKPHAGSYLLYIKYDDDEDDDDSTFPGRNNLWNI